MTTSVKWEINFNYSPLRHEKFSRPGKWKEKLLNFSAEENEEENFSVHLLKVDVITLNFRESFFRL